MPHRIASPRPVHSRSRSPARSLLAHSSRPLSCTLLPFMIHLGHSPPVSTPTTQPLTLQSNDHFSWSAIPTPARDSETRALNKDSSPSVPSPSIAPPFSPDKAIQNTPPIPRLSSLTPSPTSPRRAQNASPDPPPNPQHDPAVENPPPSRPLTPLSELSPVPDNDEDAPPDVQSSDKGEGSSSLQPTSSSPLRQIPINLEATSSHIRVSPSRPHPTASDHSPQRSSFSAPASIPSIPKATFVLQINSELIKCAFPTSASPYSC